jgi:large subunit ribosomal protein L31
MQQNIHPKYNQADVTCVCGAKFQVGSTLATIDVDICSNCHPFFTNEMRFVDRKGRVDAFQKAQNRAQDISSTRGGAKSKKNKADQKSYQEILEEQKKSL